MTTKGIRISDGDNVLLVTLPDILREINNGNLLNWSILYLYGMGNLKDGGSIEHLENNINKSKNGFFIRWNELNALANNFDQVYDIIIIASRDEELLHRYEIDQEMYETCDIVIEMIDSGYWEVFSKDEDLIKRLGRKFKDIKFLESDFQKNFYK